MLALHASTVLQHLCMATKKWGMFINISSDDSSNPYGEILKAAPYLNLEDHGQLIVDGQGWLLFDSEEEMVKHYDLTVGDDGPTQLNNYSADLARVYALTCSPDGQLLNENT